MITSKHLIASTLFIIALAVLALVWQTPNSAVGSVMPGGEYMATTTSGVAAGIKSVAPNKVVTLGSVVIASSTTGTMTIKNATSSIDTASTTVITFPANATPGTYTFDADLTRGLFVELGTGFAGDYVITYRSQ